MTIEKPRLPPERSGRPMTLELADPVVSCGEVKNRRMLAMVLGSQQGNFKGFDCLLDFYAFFRHFQTVPDVLLKWI